MCRYLSERYSIYKEIYPFDLINYTETHSGRTFPYRGMTYADYCSILSKFGAYPLILRLKKDKSSSEIDEEEFKNLYTYIESGFPILASFQGHVITIIGHTIDYQKTLLHDHENFIDSSHFIKQFIVCDDNRFPYQLLGYEDDPKNYGSIYDDQYNIKSIVTAVCPLPEKVFLPAEKARQKTLKYFNEYKGNLESISKGPWITRLLLTTNYSFKRRKLEKALQSSEIDKISYFISGLTMPHFIWLMEISSIDSYKRGKCIAEIVLDPTSTINEDSTIYIRIGNLIIFDNLEKVISNTPCEFYQYTHNLGEK